jgi:hypothetical protein
VRAQGYELAHVFQDGCRNALGRLFIFDYSRAVCLGVILFYGPQILFLV